MTFRGRVVSTNFLDGSDGPRSRERHHGEIRE
jgi:hypothetical protein